MHYNIFFSKNKENKMQFDGYDINTLYETLKRYPRLTHNLPLLYMANKDYNAIKSPACRLR